MVESGNWPIREEKVCFGGLKIRKLGNIYILAEWSRSDGKKRRLVLGPYWHFLIITLAVVTTVSLMIYVWVIPNDEKLERIIGLSLTILAVTSLLCTALNDPGIFPRYSKPLAQNWTYSEYAQSYRPPGVIYCQQCQVLIEESARRRPRARGPLVPARRRGPRARYNHFCPWSGIVIGKGNEAYFQVFISAIVVALLYDVVIVALSLHDIGF